MTRSLLQSSVIVSLVVTLAALAGCASSQAKQEASRPAPVVLPPPVVSPSGPGLESDPNTWAKGELFEVWPYGNGEVAGYLGRKDGVRAGDLLVLSRDGAIINTVEVLSVHKETFYGRVSDRAADAVEPQVGDMVLRGPQPLILEPRHEVVDQTAKQ